MRTSASICVTREKFIFIEAKILYTLLNINEENIYIMYSMTSRGPTDHGAKLLTMHSLRYKHFLEIER